jgi:hypothetical protein
MYSIFGESCLNRLAETFLSKTAAGWSGVAGISCRLDGAALGSAAEQRNDNRRANNIEQS